MAQRGGGLRPSFAGVQALVQQSGLVYPGGPFLTEHYLVLFEQFKTQDTAESLTQLLRGYCSVRSI